MNPEGLGNKLGVEPRSRTPRTCLVSKRVGSVCGFSQDWLPVYLSPKHANYYYKYYITQEPISGLEPLTSRLQGDHSAN